MGFKLFLLLSLPHLRLYRYLHIPEHHHGHDQKEHGRQSGTCLGERKRQRQAAWTYPDLEGRERERIIRRRLFVILGHHPHLPL